MTRTSPFRHEPLQALKKFWTDVEVGPAGPEGWPVLLDGRPVRTPAKRVLALPTEPLARMIADEWIAQGDLVEFAAMPATKLAFTALDLTPNAREATAREVARWAGSDVVCYLADGPSALVERERAAWDAWLAWAERELGLGFVRCAGVVHQDQPPETLARVEALALEEDDFALTALAWATALFGSAVLALAVRRGALDAVDAFERSRVDEVVQAEQWGEDAEAAERTARLRDEARLLGRWFEASTGPA